MKQNSFEIITPKERLHMNKIKANYDDVIIEFEIDKNRLTVKAENLPTKPIVSKTLYHGIGIESEYGDDYVKLRTVSKSEGLNERMANMEKNTNIPLMNFFQISMRLHMEIKKLMSKIHFYFLLQI